MPNRFQRNDNHDRIYISVGAVNMFMPENHWHIFRNCDIINIRKIDELRTQQAVEQDDEEKGKKGRKTTLGQKEGKSFVLAYWVSNTGGSKRLALQGLQGAPYINVCRVCLLETPDWGDHWQKVQECYSKNKFIEFENL
jgi:hypothetical protein